MSDQACGEGGPTVLVTSTGFSNKLKPPLKTAFFEILARNPSVRPVWVLLDMAGTSPGRVARVRVFRIAAERHAYVWEFETEVTYGPGVAVYVPDLMMVRVAAGTNALLRDVRRVLAQPVSQQMFWVASEIDVDGRPVETRIGVDGVTDSSELVLPVELGDAPRVEHTRAALGEGNVRMSLLCRRVVEVTPY
jgi:hypothetical protein